MPMDITHDEQVKYPGLQATVETVLLYGSQYWTLDSKLRKRIDGCSTRLLRMAQNISWKSNTSNEKLYNGSPTDIVDERMLYLAGQCIQSQIRNGSLPNSMDTHTRKNRRGRQQFTFIEILKLQTRLENIDEIRSVVLDRGEWKKLLRGRRK